MGATQSCARRPIAAPADTLHRLAGLGQAATKLGAAVARQRAIALLCALHPRNEMYRWGRKPGSPLQVVSATPLFDRQVLRVTLRLIGAQGKPVPLIPSALARDVAALSRPARAGPAVDALYAAAHARGNEALVAWVLAECAVSEEARGRQRAAEAERERHNAVHQLHREARAAADHVISSDGPSPRVARQTSQKTPHCGRHRKSPRCGKRQKSPRCGKRR
jgi:hypothetical protein